MSTSHINVYDDFYVATAKLKHTQSDQQGRWRYTSVCGTPTLVSHQTVVRYCISHEDAIQSFKPEECESIIITCPKLDSLERRLKKAEAKLLEWEEKDGNSPGYNKQKADSYGTLGAMWKNVATSLYEALKIGKVYTSHSFHELKGTSAEANLVSEFAKINEAIASYEDLKSNIPI